MLRVGLELTTPVFERANIFRGLDLTTNFIGTHATTLEKL
jgi:hypothetical protein